MNEQWTTAQPAERHAEKAPHNERQPRVSFDSLADGQPEVLIEFRDHIYRLRVTRNGKLILNK